ncbi:hypothetical protein P886_3817 [Alteromonadaceae bacterium 2753L.S.0a.02]|nr:hypothetical protein P886_3817 [Alteromonadaceae bacterium 2753L.S.0a.02]
MAFKSTELQNVEQSAGKRLQVIRFLTGITREEFAEMFEFDITRLKNMEQDRCRVSEYEFRKIGERLPELLPWLAFAGEISLERIKANDDSLMRMIVARLESRSIKPQVLELLADKIK